MPRSLKAEVEFIEKWTPHIFTPQNVKNTANEMREFIDMYYEEAYDARFNFYEEFSFTSL